MSIKAVRVEEHEFKNVYWVHFEDGSARLATVNLTPGRRVYGEQLINMNGVEYRVWNPYRSKLAAALMNGLKVMPLGEGSEILYLGAASGTTVSHMSDIVGPSGTIYGVEFSPRVFREFMERIIDQGRRNVIPILADARYPEQYISIVKKVDLVYIDVAQPFQAKVLADNADVFLNKDGRVVLVIKAMSIDVTKEPSETFKREIDALKERGFDVEATVHLEPYDVAHALVVGRKI